MTLATYYLVVDDNIWRHIVVRAAATSVKVATFAATPIIASRRVAARHIIRNKQGVTAKVVSRKSASTFGEVHAPAKIVRVRGHFGRSKSVFRLATHTTQRRKRASVRR